MPVILGCVMMRDNARSTPSNWRQFALRAD